MYDGEGRARRESLTPALQPGALEGWRQQFPVNQALVGEDTPPDWLRRTMAGFCGLFVYMVSLGMLLTFGLLGFFSVVIGFATLPSAGNLLGTDTTPVVFATAVPTRSSTGSSSTVSYGGNPAPSAAPQAKASDSWAGLKGFLRLVTFVSAFLAIWPAGYAALRVDRSLR